MMNGQINIQTMPYTQQSNQKRSPVRKSNRSPARSGSRLSKSPGRRSVSPGQSSAANNDQRIQKLEAMVSKLTCAQHGLGRFTTDENAFHSSFGTLDQKLQNNNHSEDLNNLVHEVDKQMKDVEDRIVNHLMQQMEEQSLILNHKVDGLEQRVQTVEIAGNRAATSERREAVLQSSEIT